MNLLIMSGQISYTGVASSVVTNANIVTLNVLMLGWELPPYNSGGLGTACLGMTEGLADQAVKIKFVVPKVFGKFPFNHMSVVSAVDYDGEGFLQQLLQREDVDSQLVTSQLAYGGSISIDEKKRLLIEHLRQQLPISPQVQADWYAHQTAEIANTDDNYDVVHGHDWFTYLGGIAARQVAKEHGRTVPFIAHVHATELDRSGKAGDPQIIEIERRGLQAADHVIAVSHFTKELLHQHYRIPRQKISVVHNGISPSKQPKHSSLKQFKRNHKIVLFMGRLTMQKGPDYFVKLAHAISQVDPNIRFVMVGSGDMEKRCIEESARLGLTGKLLFSSFLRGNDVNRAYQLADLFVMPSVSEPFGIVALEAMQNGTPVLVSKQSGVAEVSKHVIKVDFWDIAKMQQEVLAVLAKPSYRQRLRTGATADLQRLTWDVAATKLQTIYRQVIEDLIPVQLPMRPLLATA